MTLAQEFRQSLNLPAKWVNQFQVFLSDAAPVQSLWCAMKNGTGAFAPVPLETVAIELDALLNKHC